MITGQYKEHQLTDILLDLRSKLASGILHLEAEIDVEIKSKNCILVWRDGQITYGGLNLPTHQEFAKMIGKKLNREWIDTAIAFAIQKATDKTSIRAVVELLVKMRLFTWEQIETVVHAQVEQLLKQVLPYAGQFQFDTTTQFDLCYGEVCHGLDWSKLMLDVTRSQEQESSTPKVPRELPTVLTVDDSALMQQLIKQTLERSYRVLVASNSIEALGILCHDNLALLLLDVSMPGIDGFGLCKTVRQQPKFRDLPIIMLTARDGIFDKAKGRMAGATEYLTKPFDEKQLLQVVAKYVPTST